MNLAEEMKKRNMTEEHLMEYMLFEDECISKGFTLKSLIEAREKQIPKKPIHKEGKSTLGGKPVHYSYDLCPFCEGGALDKGQAYCIDCGQELDWSDTDGKDG